MFGSEEEKQKELFEEFQHSEGKFTFFKGKTKFLHSKYFNMQFSVEKLVFVLIGIIIAAVLMFCFGVECGKKTSVPAENAVLRKPCVQQPAQQFKPAPIVMASQRPAAVPAAAVKKAPASRQIQKQVPGSVYTIRIATYIDKKTAGSVLARIKAKGFPAYSVPSGKFVMICVGDYKNRNQADTALIVLKKEHKDSYIKTTVKK